MGQIKVEKNVGGIEGLCVIDPAVHGDARGYFMETYNEKDMKEADIDIHFVQDNQSMSTKGGAAWSALPEAVSAVQVGTRCAWYCVRCCC